MVIALLLLGGCGNMQKTFFAHYTLNSQATATVANLNAIVNFCLSEGLLDKYKAYEFSSVAASYMDLTVSDGDFYAMTYNNRLESLISNRQNRASTEKECQTATANIGRATEHLSQRYLDISKELGVMREAERQQMIQTISNFGKHSGPTFQLSFPQVTYVKEEPKNVNYLVHTNSGLSHCRMTRENFVFCLPM